MRTTYMPKAGQVDRKWLVLDATGKPLGRLASEVARILIGKHKPIYTPSVDTGDNAIIINADKVVLTGNKAENKYYYRHSGFAGGLKKVTYGTLIATKPEKAVEIAVKGMLPHNRLGRAMFRKIHVYSGNEHPHQAQKPEVWEF